MRALPIIAILVATPALAWQTALSITPPASRPAAVTVDANGDVLAVGRVTVVTDNDDALVAKLAGADGGELWQRTFAGSAGAADVLRSVATDATSHVVAAGQLVNTTTAGDILVTKHDASGGQVWRVEIDGGASGEDDGLAVALDATGAVVVAGQATPTGQTTTRFTVVKRAAADGASEWRTDLSGDGGSGRAVVVDGSDVFAAGDAGDLIVATRLAGATGTPAWRTDVPGSASAADVGRALAVGGGRVVVAGRMVTTTGGQDFAVVALDATTGQEAWRYVVDGTATGAADADDAFGVAVDAAGDVIAVGRLSDAATDDDLLLVKLAGASGMVLWRTPVNGGNDNADVGQAVALDAAGNVLVAGTIRNPGTRADFLVAKFSGSTGIEVWRHELDGTEHAADTGLAVAASAGTHLVAAGRVRNGDTGDGFVVVKRTGANGGDFPCADGAPDQGEGCDDGNVVAGDGCRPDCTVEVCGDGIRDPQETCDDGNTQGGDCCSGACALEPDGGPCDDDDACTLGNACAAGTCVFTERIVCTPASPCHTAVCDPVDASCSSVPKGDGAICDDQNACTVLDRCIALVCTGTITPACGDDEPCTMDGCDPALGCVNEPLAGFPSVSCAFERTTIVMGCTEGVPGPIESRIDKARRLVAKAEASDRTRRARRALGDATKALRQAVRLASTRLKRGKITPACAAAIDTALSDVVARADGVRAALTD
ncbi:MAG: PQQ-binding-like beta-propeller repeat protein [Candidatus Binatia bacterium]